MSRTFGRVTHPLDHESTPLRRLASLGHDGLALVCEALGRSPLPLPVRSIDWVDERLALARRAAFGRRRCLLSWQRRPDGSWLARLSGPGTDRTIERSARTRSGAIVRTARALFRLRDFRDRERSGPGPDSQHAHTP